MVISSRVAIACYPFVLLQTERLASLFIGLRLRSSGDFQRSTDLILEVEFNAKLGSSSSNTNQIYPRTLTARVASTPKVSPQIIWSEAGFPKIAQHMFSLMLCNLASDGFLFLDPNHPDPTDPQSYSLPGCVIAAPSFPANTPV